VRSVVENLRRIRDMIKFQEQYIVDEKGRKTAVILPIEEYEELLEDLHDLAIIAERRDEPTISFEELKKRLRKDGVL
jgi:PHD/YefM family antitoxin component YafN of YafNO toxin-antitoxin module